MNTLLSRSGDLLTGSRYFFSILLAIFVSVDSGSSRTILLFIAIGIFLSDALDGTFARRFGPKRDMKIGRVFDLMADDFIIITGAFSFAINGLMPIWLALIMIWTRLFLTLIRFLKEVRNEPFAGPRFSTKLKGWVYGFGLLIIILGFVSEDFNLLSIYQQVMDITFFSMGLATVFAAVDFIYFHRNVILSLYRGEN